jgi:hypothetical protein
MVFTPLNEEGRRGETTVGCGVELGAAIPWQGEAGAALEGDGS